MTFFANANAGKSRTLDAGRNSLTSMPPFLPEREKKKWEGKSKVRKKVCNSKYIHTVTSKIHPYGNKQCLSFVKRKIRNATKTSNPWTSYLW
jgi:predicted transcriptional regulator